MSRNILLVKFACLVLAVVGFANLLRPAAAAPQDLPAGPGVELARERCLNCHEADLIVAQRLSRPGWVREVEKMVRWGAVVNDAEKEMLVEYFSARFAPRAAGPATVANETRGKEIFENKCLLCHEIDLTKQQRLSRPGWVREVEKMVRWGAVVAEDEKEPLVDYLFKNYGPRPLK